MVIVESEEQFENFIDQYRYNECILIPIFTDVNKHPCQNPLSLMYVKLLDGEEYILPFNHSEAVNLPIALLYDLDFDNTKYVYDKKVLNHIFKMNNVVDVNLAYYLKHNVALDANVQTPAHEFFNMMYRKVSNINKVIPILKHLEYCRNLVNIMEPELYNPINEYYNDDMIDCLWFIENSGIQWNDKKVYSEYNLYTITGRPSNKFGGINYAALNKTDGSRKAIKSRFGDDGILIEFDYVAYHPQLIAKLVGYKFPDENVYEHLDQYFGLNDRDEIKRLVFKYQYGNIPKNVSDNIEYFGLINTYMYNLWDEFNRMGEVKSFLFDKSLRATNLSDMNKNKLFNYQIQLMETEYNIMILSKVIPILEEYSSKLMLYGYDSFLIDTILDEKDSVLSTIRTIIGLEFPIKVSIGHNYHEMHDFNVS